MTARPKHTPEPWKLDVQKGPAYCAGEIDAADDSAVAFAYGTNAESIANAARIVACVNACAGLNPEAIPALIEAAARLASVPEGSHLCLGAHDRGPHYGAAVDAWNAMHDALAAVKGVSK